MIKGGFRFRRTERQTYFYFKFDSGVAIRIIKYSSMSHWLGQYFFTGVENEKDSYMVEGKNVKEVVHKLRINHPKFKKVLSRISSKQPIGSSGIRQK